MLCDWRNRPHLRRFYQKTPITLPELQAEYHAILHGEEPGHCHLSFLDDRPFGYAQCYRIMDWPDYSAKIEVSDGIGVDYFIADPALIGRGLGRAMLGAYLREIAFPLFPGERRSVVCHEQANAASHGVLKSLGFA